mmetsp:Transcript_48751/g.99152  ORF Transcript_48751/g.99152 Transcript_48751/m.99152 type:complete len:200 (+) Transcript_48751:794-1393(+)
MGSPLMKLQQHRLADSTRLPIGQHVPLVPKTSTHRGCLMQLGSASKGTAPVSFTMHLSLSRRVRCSTMVSSKMRLSDSLEGHSPTFLKTAPRWTGARTLFSVGLAGVGGSRNQEASTHLDPFHLCKPNSSAGSQQRPDSQRDCTSCTQRTSWAEGHCMPTHAPVQSVFSAAICRKPVRQLAAQVVKRCPSLTSTRRALS